jgi:hypothetical protein
MYYFAVSTLKLLINTKDEGWSPKVINSIFNLVSTLICQTIFEGLFKGGWPLSKRIYVSEVPGFAFIEKLAYRLIPWLYG